MIQDEGLPNSFRVNGVGKYYNMIKTLKNWRQCIVKCDMQVDE